MIPGQSILNVFEAIEDAANHPGVVPPFDPPYESPLEEAFAWGFAKYLHPEATLRKQVWSRTAGGNFRLDFVARRPEWAAVGFECDGAKFHEVGRDERRDALILAAGEADVIYRLRGRDLFRYLDEVLAALTREESHLFSDRGRDQLARLTNGRVLEWTHAWIEVEVSEEDEDERRTDRITIWRHSPEQRVLR